MASHWKPSNMPAQNGRRAIITGAGGGIGFPVALALARHGASVVIASRDRAKGEGAIARIRREIPSATVEFLELDLASLAGVRSFAERELARGAPLDLLINNAGVYAPPKRRETVDGFELQFGTNVLGHFALTGLLLPALERAAQTDGEAPRVVTVASIAHKVGRLNFEDLQSRMSYSPSRSYQQSKLADLVFALELGRRLRRCHSLIWSVAAHPGVANTDLFKVGARSAIESRLRETVGHLVGAVLNDASEGALPTIYASTAAEAESGGYYGPQGLFEARGGDVGPAKITPRALDPEAARRLWGVCEELTGVAFLDAGTHPA